MRTETEIATMLADIVGTIDVTAKRRLDRGRLIGTICMVSALEWALGRNDQGGKLLRIARAELDAATRHANR